MITHDHVIVTVLTGLKTALIKRREKAFDGDPDIVDGLDVAIKIVGKWLGRAKIGRME